ncbi:MAG: helix-turn-helix transcriptional regulator [Candidatus Dormibacteraeota bacterium]|nr:helix-turn-helix transcriptional regulator [Candidatus Dormibacteraeota bacterium]MBO0762346.1 helix-turn-helix transcriptional regulator [Candidatus Dormibacteraeota bacterium]
MTTTTAGQRREEAKHAYDAFMADCPTRQLLESLSDKWLGLLVHALADGPKRHGQLAHKVAGVSQKMLTQTLRTLERDGLVTRTVTASVPVRVDYALTPLGRDLLPVMVAVKRWAETHMDEVNAARRAYDLRGGEPSSGGQASVEVGGSPDALRVT